MSDILIPNFRSYSLLLRKALGRTLTLTEQSAARRAFAHKLPIMLALALLEDIADAARDTSK